MIIYKACTRCRGDLLKIQDIYGTYLSCLQCGHVIEDSRKQLDSESYFGMKEAPKGGL